MDQRNPNTTSPLFIETLGIRLCTARCCPAENVNIYSVKKWCWISKHHRTIMFQILHLCLCFEQISNRFYLVGKERSMICLVMLGKNVQAECLCLYSLQWGEKVLDLLSKSHLPNVRIKRLNKYLRWLVCWVFELQSGVTTGIYRTLIQPWCLWKHTRIEGPKVLPE